MTETLTDYIKNYENTEDRNDYLFEHFTQKTNSVKFLKDHRDYVEAENLGFGDRAFAFMWYLLMKHVNDEGLALDFLEIGVFKGQVISLWSLIARELNLDIKVTGITPLAGNPAEGSAFLKKIKYRVSKKFKENIDSGNYYEEVDYLNTIKGLFDHFDLDFYKTQLIKGYSTDRAIIDTISAQKFAMIYIDGDHTYQGVIDDINNYALRVAKGGFLIMDDASFFLPGSKFWKGHRSVSEASAIIGELPFKNVLNIGHNRIYQKL